MRSIQVACAGAILALVTVGAAAAKDAATTIPNSSTLASMSSDDLRAFLAGSALNIDNVLRVAANTAALGQFRVVPPREKRRPPARGRDQRARAGQTPSMTSADIVPLARFQRAAIQMS